MDVLKGARILSERIGDRDLKHTPLWGLNYMRRPDDEERPEGVLPIYDYLGLEPPPESHERTG